MRRLARPVLTVGVTVLAIAAGAATAMAFWSDAGTRTPADLAVGGVQFGAYGESGADPQYSPDGGAVTLTLPGSEIARVLDQTGPDPQPVVWRFTAQGYAQGIAGMVYDVSVASQQFADGAVTDLSSGMAVDQTILAFSTMKVYPASVNGDCSSIPATPAGSPRKNVYVFDGSGHLLQHSGAYGGSAVEQEWCVALSYNQQLDGVYANDVRATGTASDGSQISTIAHWSAAVAFPPSLDSLGDYLNRGDVVATADDGSLSRDSDLFRGAIYPDPSNEPDVTIVLNPAVTSTNPSIRTGDHFTAPASP